jgi:hypothetical protein
LNTALVTGTIDHLHTVAMALKSEGFEVIAWEWPTPGGANSVTPGSVDCYVQLPPTVLPATEARPVGAGAVAHRVDTVARVAPLLAPDALVLVAVERGWDTASRNALHTLAGAALTRRVGSGVRVAVAGSVDPGDIAAAARRERGGARTASLADLAPGMAYADWREEVFSLTSSAESTYFGWRRDDGARRAAVLRRSVLSPLPGADDGARGLARAVLADALGGAGSGELQLWAESLADDFLKDVIESLPEEEFELPIHEVAAWIVRRSLAERETTTR